MNKPDDKKVLKKNKVLWLNKLIHALEEADESIYQSGFEPATITINMTSDQIKKLLSILTSNH